MKPMKPMKPVEPVEPVEQQTSAAAGRVRSWSALALLVLIAVVGSLPAGAAAEQASQPQSSAAAQLDADAGTDPSGHTCAVLAGASVRCWGYGVGGRLGYASETTIGDNETPGAAGPVVLGAGAAAISSGAFHTCAQLTGGSVRCWGFGVEGRLGYANESTIGDDEHPGAVGPVNLGEGRTATAISAGGGHTCAVLDDGNVRCWGFGNDGRLGYGAQNDIGDDEHPGGVGPVYLAAERTATAITAGDGHTCALLNGGDVRCWGLGFLGRLGYGDTLTIGDDETPGSVGPVDLGPGRTAQAISAGGGHTCALLDDGSVRCWGFGGQGRLGYANTRNIGDDETPGSVGPVDLGAGRTAVAISAGGRHTCARLDDGSVRCWGYGFTGRLGYCNEQDVGDDESPGSVGPVNLSTAVFCPRAAPPAPAAPAPAGPAPSAPAPARPAPSTPVAAGPVTAKLSLARGRIIRRDRVLDVLAPITSLASGSAGVELHAAGLIYSFRAQLNERDGRIRFRKRIPKAQAQLGTAILTIAYPGDADTRPQTVRLRAASQPANLRLARPTITGGRLRAAGSLSKRARGVVRVQIEYVVAGESHTREFKARIANGRWSLNKRLSQTVRTAIAQRTGTVHSYTLFTGYYQRRIRGEMRSYQILGPP